MRCRLVLLAILLVAPAGLHAQTVTGSGTYCITGTSGGTDYSWWVDLGADVAGIATEPRILNQNYVLPVSASANAMAAAFADQINLCTAGLHFCDIGVTDQCLSGPNTGAPCTTDHDCNSHPSCSSSTCVGGPLAGNSCTVLDDCNCVSATATGNCFTISTSLTYALRVDVANANPPTCLVGTSGCAYNPMIALVDPVPSLPSWAWLALFLVAAFALAMRSRTRS